MNTQQKLEILADAAKYDASCASSGARRSGNGKGVGHSDGTGICHSYTPDGRCVSLLKILLTNFCTYDCIFCVNRISSDIQRARFTPEEVVKLTLDFYKRNYIEGLFLSSGIIQSPDYTMEQLIHVAKALRTEHHFGGYIHLKAIPGASELLIDQAGLFADRLSANIELPTQQDLVQLAPEKKTTVIESTMNKIALRKDEADEDRRKLPSAPKFATAGQSTQMVIGATPATDREILTTATHLYGQYKLRRIYYTGFSPYPAADARLPLKPTPMMREHRLYQSDWLMRFYGFNAAELTSEENPSLSLTEDPKTTWAKLHPEFFPVDVNAAPRESLLRVPGIGYRNVERILSIRKYHLFLLDDLKKLRVRIKSALPYLITIDHAPRQQPSTHESQLTTQLDLFASVSALTGSI
ncbi:putative DNA modification/repair radical SAM protein [Tunturiibacter gelidoferens]|uniref:Putative DNA modification/repair radical SAM protein n=1 Tax=Tunturiibacter lichenicola TaxID=2051959 RepID=A0A7Y9NN91_9BACT|nr:putative DNA modification/repair radical SAM protein [Edaphobacter lichenicola]NYF51980.1 putative DNA modification/repair radical SAM protein [Edaphobacter lichenicola]